MTQSDLTDQASGNYVSRGRRPRAEVLATLLRHPARGLAHSIGVSLKSAGEFGRRAAKALVRSHKRRAAVSELEALDDRTLKDIGVQRSQIPWMVDELLDGATVSPPRSTQRLAGPAADRGGSPQPANDAAAEVAA